MDDLSSRRGSCCQSLISKLRQNLIKFTRQVHCFYSIMLEYANIVFGSMPIKMLFLPLSARVSIAAIQSQLMQAR